MSVDFIPTTGPVALNPSLPLTELQLSSAQGQSNYCTFTPIVTSCFSLFSSLSSTKVQTSYAPLTLISSPHHALTHSLTSASRLLLLFLFVHLDDLTVTSAFLPRCLLDSCCSYILFLFILVFSKHFYPVCSTVNLVQIDLDILSITCFLSNTSKSAASICCP